MPGPRTIQSQLAPVAAIAAASVALAGCSTGQPAASGEPAPSGEASTGLTIEQVQEAGTLVVGTEGTYSPFSFHEGGAGELTGYDVEIITAVAEELGVEVEFVETPWDAIFAALDAGRVDVIANQVSITPERLERYVFSEPYTYSPGVLIVPQGSDIASFDDLAGRTSAQSLTSNWAEIATEAGADVEEVEGFAQAAELLRSGRVDATINDRLTYLDYVQSQGGETGLVDIAETEETSENALAFRAGSESLVTAVDEALATLAEDGTLAEISERYFGEDVSQP
ncbi:amino acid ABC transporter substrate-binding protein [Agrococcus jenensis]|uniref:Amino acid ABC transporter substrate-binding protein (PAAT family) n=1 Tax=Agrococcus jenensis TaxID=46353 RepID=A0A3N2AVU1_9MICO|nr:amino acid ABC transporter substrate-binding protein [Agrococcus jenensis]ROR67143.1 amino acid ABC transporter substrate-binding protein (PAAT family) [Agrococcus jenensis]